jgi:polynucleotide 5'-kinase involved in rRNA processing
LRSCATSADGGGIAPKRAEPETPGRGTEIAVAREWERIDASLLGGLIMVVGGADAGKTTFARWLYRRSAEASPAAFLDGDPGQGVFGPPATVTLAAAVPGDGRFPPGGPWRRMFVGAVTPRGHMLRHLVAVARLVEAARRDALAPVIYDTSGLVDPRAGGLALKLAKIDLLQPDLVVAIRRNGELEPLLRVLRRRRRPRLVELPCSPCVRRRDPVTRRQYRNESFARYFSGARAVELDAARLSLVPRHVPRFNQLVALEDVQGFTLALGIVVATRPLLRLLTPLLRDPGDVDNLRLGDLVLDPETFAHRRILRSEP